MHRHFLYFGSAYCGTSWPSSNGNGQSKGALEVLWESVFFKQLVTFEVSEGRGGSGRCHKTLHPISCGCRLSHRYCLKQQCLVSASFQSCQVTKTVCSCGLKGVAAKPWHPISCGCRLSRRDCLKQGWQYKNIGACRLGYPC